ncbi:MAG: glycosyltransferase [Candidatus Aenigmatarchaeota archaeon]
MAKDFIFVTVGTHYQPFNRLLQGLDELFEKGKIKHKIIAQIGNSTYLPKNYKFFRFSSEKERAKLIKRAKFIINHGGAGSVIESLIYRKPTIIFPRQVKYNEHYNNSAVTLANMLDKKGFAIKALEVRDLPKALKKAESFKIKMVDYKSLKQKLDLYLKELSKKL